MRRRLRLGVLVLALTGCAAPSISLTPSISPHAEHDAQADRVKAALSDAFGMTFEPAGPHHQLGTAPDGVQLDLVGEPVEEVVLSLPSADRSAAADAGLAYLPHLRDLLHGPSAVWDWVADALVCRAAEGGVCQAFMTQGELTARFTDGGPDYLVLEISRRP
jgi:hypothetical protein